ncbi:MAG TPA: MFS transporter [Beijerinckiaceae bacterium]|nr:MFS transporter [Beijerinckiaceae bacterium]
MRHRAFALFWWGRMLAMAAYQMLAVAIGWQLYALTGSALDLGFLGLIQFVPVIGAVLVVGHVADQYDRRFVVVACHAAQGAAAAILALGSLGGWLSRETIFLLVFVIGTARAFELPTMHALVPGLVPASLLSRAIAGATSATQTAVIAGPAIGGLVYLAGPAILYGACVVLFATAATLVLAIRTDLPAPVRRPPTLATLLAGFAFVRERPVLLGAISLDLFAVLLGSATALLPIFTRDILEAGPWGLGLLRASPAVGALAAALVLARNPLRAGVGRTMFACVVVFGLATLAFALSRSLVLSMLCLVILGVADSTSVIIRFSLVQFATPDEMRGRVSAINALFTGTSNTLGEFRAGAVAALVGVVPAAVAGGLGAVLVALVWMRLFPTLRRRDRIEEP